MHKSRRNTKKAKYMKHIVVMIVIQIAIVAVFAQIDQINEQIDLRDLKSAEIIVDSTSYNYLFLGGSKFSLSASETCYTFPKFPVSGTSEYSMKQLYEAISPGDSLSIQYIIEGDQNLILDAELDGTALRSVNVYKQHLEKQRKLTCIIYTIVETVFLLVVLSIFSFWLFINHKEIKRRFLRKVRK